MLLILTSAFGLGVYRTAFVNHAIRSDLLAKLREGMTEAEVQNLLGPPRKIVPAKPVELLFFGSIDLGFVTWEYSGFPARCRVDLELGLLREGQPKRLLYIHHHHR